TLIRDAAGQTTGAQLADGTTETAARDAIGQVTAQSDATGAVMARGYDALGRATSVADPLGDTSTATWDPNGNVRMTTNELGGTTRYAWDAAGQFIGIDYHDDTPDVSYAHDADGRRTSMTDGTGTTRYIYDDAGRFIATTDGAGAIVATSYDLRGALTGITYPDGLTVAYAHDTLRRLVSVTDSLGHQGTFAYDPDGRLVRSTLGDGTVETRTYDANRSLLSIVGGPLDLGYTRDPLGRVASITRDQGKPQQTTRRCAWPGTFAFDAYGKPTGHTGPAATRIGFGGNYTDLGSGLQYLLARVYDPATAQFLTVDPLVLATKQPYAFAASDPLTYGDPTGLDVTLAGHGWFDPSNGMTTVPDGTTVIFHTPAGWTMTDALGVEVERSGRSRYEERYGPGAVIPNYVLGKPSGLHTQPTSRTVTVSTPLSGLLRPNHGDVHWAACRVVDNRGTGSSGPMDKSFDPVLVITGSRARHRAANTRATTPLGASTPC
ncbi:MAG: hypothetical protein LH650_10380, partial [Chloroflexi bacterium]|nr:hypothetical protein [Chloroflexota bacterium]